MSWYEIQGLSFGLLMSSMLKIVLPPANPNPWPHLALYRKILRVPESPSSCHDTVQSWHDSIIKPTWQQTKPSIVARCNLLRATKFPVLNLCPTFTYRATNQIHRGTILNS